jgi:hypothetical protein
MDKKGYYIIAGGILFIGALIFINKKIKNKQDSSVNDEKIEDKKEKILFLGGLDGKGYKNISQQEELIKNGLKKGADIDSYRYTNPQGIIDSIKNNPNSYVILFSAGAKHSSSVANEIVKNKGDLNKMFIIEPYNDFKTTYDSVNKAIKLGVPQKNVWIGTTQGTGLGIVNNPTKTPYCLPKHWCSLSEIGKKI